MKEDDWCPLFAGSEIERTGCSDVGMKGRDIISGGLE